MLSSSSVSSSIGRLGLNPIASASDSNWLEYHGDMDPERAQPTMPPSVIDRDLSGMTRSGSTISLYPRPEQILQAPWGLLKLKVRGSNSPRFTLQCTHAKSSENIISSPPWTSTITRPSD